MTLEIGRPGGSLRGVAGDGERTFVAVTVGAEDPAKTAIEARRGSAVAWTAELAGWGGPLARSGGLLAAVVAGTGGAAGVELRGAPGAVVVGLDAASGAVRWRLAVDSSEWAVIAAAAAVPAEDGGGVVVGGSFSGTLRAGAKVVSSGGRSDGFVARVTATGEVALLARMGGPGVDAIQGVAAAPGRLVIAGTFAAGADLRGIMLDAIDVRSPYADGFVAELDPTGQPRWTATFGGRLDDAVAGVAIDGRGRVAVAATARDRVRVNGRDLRAQGPADLMVAWWERDGGAGPAVLVGGEGFDGATGIAAAGGERVVVGGFFAGTLRAGRREIAAVAGDDALVVALDGGQGGAVVEAWHAGGPGREELAALAAVPGGWVAGVAHTGGVRVDGAGASALAAPADGASGAAIVARPAR